MPSLGCSHRWTPNRGPRAPALTCPVSCCPVRGSSCRHSSGHSRCSNPSLERHQDACESSQRHEPPGLLPTECECGLCSQPIDFFFFFFPSLPPCLLWVYYCHCINYSVRSSRLCQGQPMGISSFIHPLGCPMSTASAQDVPTGKTTSCGD